MQFYPGDRTELTPMNILAFEEHWLTHPRGRLDVWRKNAIANVFRVNSTRYQQLALRALDDPEAAAAYPEVVEAMRARLQAAASLRAERSFRRAS